MKVKNTSFKNEINSLIRTSFCHFSIIINSNQGIQYVHLLTHSAEFSTKAVNPVMRKHITVNEKSKEIINFYSPGVGDGQGCLVCCDSCGCKELDTTELVN